METAAGGFFKRARAKRRESLCRPHAVRSRARSLLRLPAPCRSRARLRVRDGPRRRVGSFRPGVPAGHVSRRGRDRSRMAAPAKSPSALYAELFGLKEKDGIRQSVFRYFHGRSSLSTWLRSLVSQRFVDRHRETRRLEPLPEETRPPRFAPPSRPRSIPIARDLSRRCAPRWPRPSPRSTPRDRLRLACYYAQEMTLAAIGKLTREHEATVSRQLARTRRAIREDVERRLRDRARLLARPRSTNASRRSSTMPATSTSASGSSGGRLPGHAAGRRSLDGGGARIRTRSFYERGPLVKPRSRPHPGTGAEA